MDHIQQFFLSFLLSFLCLYDDFLDRTPKYQEAMTKLGYKVKIIKSSPRNIKLTYQDDVKVIKDLMKKI